VARECQINGRMYRQLDPEYFAWLRGRMHVVKAAADAGTVPPNVWQTARAAFNTIQERALAIFGEARLRQAARVLDAEKYRPPLPEEYEKPQALPKLQQSGLAIDERLGPARALIAGIRERALSLGWNETQLSAVPPEARHGELVAGSGLVCYLRAGDQIGAVTREAIEIILANGVRQNFYNPDVEQPWASRNKRPKN
jgi:hypothetical protein